MTKEELLNKIEEIENNEAGFIDQLVNAKDSEEFKNHLMKKGIKLTDEEAMLILNEIKECDSEELNLDSLDEVSGGIIIPVVKTTVLLIGAGFALYKMKKTRR